MTNNDIFTPAETVISSEAMLAHWQGHRRLTRRTIEAFPEDKLFTYSIGGMRPFSVLVKEMMDIASPGINGIVSRKWTVLADHNEEGAGPATKAAILQRWDEITEEINQLWQEIPAGRFAEIDMAFGLYENTIYDTLLYFIDNEIHHRAQGYVYLRSLGIEPPAFYDRN